MLLPGLLAYRRTAARKRPTRHHSPLNGAIRDCPSELSCAGRCVEQQLLDTLFDWSGIPCRFRETVRIRVQQRGLEQALQ